MKTYPVLIKHNTIKSHWEVEVHLHAFLTSAGDGGEWSASCLGHFTAWGRASGIYWAGRWVGPRGGLDKMAKRKKIPTTYWKLNPGCPVCSLVTILGLWINSVQLATLSGWY
jgi:hypothetical protein